MFIKTSHVQTGGDRRSGTLSTAELRTVSENRHLNVSGVQIRTDVLIFHQGAVTNTMKTFIIALGLASCLSLFTVDQAKSFQAGE
jgi:large exoprotein involved in heme utilization and adhesion